MDSRLQLKAASLGFLGGILAMSAWRLCDAHLAWRSIARKRRRAIDSGSPELSKMLSGSEYVFDEGLQSMVRAASELCEEYNAPCRASGTARRRKILSELLGSTGPPGQHPHVERPVHFDYGFNVHVGSNFYANVGCVFLDVAEIRIGDNCFLGPAVKLYTASHPVDAVRRRTVEFGRPITIGDDVWIGGDAVVCPGVTIGSRVVIAAGAVVTEDVPDDVIVAGVPAKVKRKLSTT